MLPHIDRATQVHIARGFELKRGYCYAAAIDAVDDVKVLSRIARVKQAVAGQDDGPIQAQRATNGGEIVQRSHCANWAQGDDAMRANGVV